MSSKVIKSTAEVHKAEAPKQLDFAVITLSTSRYRIFEERGIMDDNAGDLIVELLRSNGHRVLLRKILPDDKQQICQTIKDLLSQPDVDVIITCGGTGVTPSDITIESIHPFFEKELPGFGELFRKISYERLGSAAMLTRATAGIASNKVIFCLPGSPQAADLAMRRLILPEAPHIIKHVRWSS